VRPGQTGLVVPPADPEGLAGAIIAFFAEDMAPRLRDGVRALQAEHSWDRLAREVIALGDTLAPGRGWR